MIPFLMNIRSYKIKVIKLGFNTFLNLIFAIIFYIALTFSLISVRQRA